MSSLEIRRLLDLFDNDKMQEFNLLNESTMTADRVRTLFHLYFSADDHNVELDENNVVTVHGDCNVTDFSIERYPIVFGEITGSFDTAYTKLVTLEGGPHTVGVFYYCCYNRLNSLLGCPKHVGGKFSCEGNELESLEHLPLHGDRLVIEYSPTLPLLRCITYNSLSMEIGSEVIGELNHRAPLYILRKYLGKGGSRRDIIACQKELIDNGFEGNASW